MQPYYHHPSQFYQLSDNIQITYWQTLKLTNIIEIQKSRLSGNSVTNYGYKERNPDVEGIEQSKFYDFC